MKIYEGESQGNEFNSAYKKSGENRWIDRRDGTDYLIELRDEKWSCVVTIEPNI